MSKKGEAKPFRKRPKAPPWGRASINIVGFRITGVKAIFSRSKLERSPLFPWTPRPQCGWDPSFFGQLAKAYLPAMLKRIGQAQEQERCSGGTVR
jgi:hypothetical protein